MKPGPVLVYHTRPMKAKEVGQIGRTIFEELDDVTVDINDAGERIYVWVGSPYNPKPDGEILGVQDVVEGILGKVLGYRIGCPNDSANHDWHQEWNAEHTATCACQECMPMREVKN